MKQGVATRTYSIEEVCQIAGITEAELTSWGLHLPTESRPGWFTYEALMMAELMARLVKSGFEVEAAAEIAVKLRKQGWTGSVDLAPGLVLIQELDTSQFDGNVFANPET